MTDRPFAGGLAWSAIGLALIGIALNDSGMVAGTRQGNLGVTIPVALAGFVCAFLAQVYYARYPRTEGPPEVQPSASPFVQSSQSILLFAAVAAPMLFPPPLGRSVVIGGIGAAMLVAGVRGHMMYTARQPAR